MGPPARGRCHAIDFSRPDILKPVESFLDWQAHANALAEIEGERTEINNDASEEYGPPLPSSSSIIDYPSSIS